MGMILNHLGFSTVSGCEYQQKIEVLETSANKKQISGKTNNIIKIKSLCQNNQGNLMSF